MRAIRFGFIISLLICTLAGWASQPDRVWFSIDETKQVKMEVDLFLSTTCPYCKQMDQFFKELEPKAPWLNVHRHVINKDTAALDTFNQFLKEQGAHDFIVPSAFFCNTRWQGFSINTSSQLWKGLTYCHDQIVKTGNLSPADHQVLKQMALASWYENSIVGKPTALTIVPGLAIIDALSTTSLFSILILWAFLVIIKQRYQQAGAAILFLLAVGTVHLVQQNHTDFFYHAIDYLRFPTMLIGLALILFVLAFHHKGFAKKKNKSFWMFLGIILFTAFTVQAYLQLATPNFSLVFYQWLIAQNYSSLRTLSYEFIYLYIYLIMIGGIAVGLYALGRVKRWFKRRKFIEEFAWQYLLLIGLMLLCYPYLLAKSIFILITLVIAFIAAKIAERSSKT